ncbi:hypothetical protein RRG08_031275 [Elysia crispata]|uniref:Uncharacterized protein n=1 Tax=Elysia crispata TaxID=231223 RepID=A0AAE1AIV8_9GAST|nr:hypothetical protein RRG08_031275 [Elysia crispata]
MLTSVGGQGYQWPHEDYFPGCEPEIISRITRTLNRLVSASDRPPPQQFHCSDYLLETIGPRPPCRCRGFRSTPPQQFHCSDYLLETIGPRPPCRCGGFRSTPP